MNAKVKQVKHVRQSKNGRMNIDKGLRALRYEVFKEAEAVERHARMLDVAVLELGAVMARRELLYGDLEGDPWLTADLVGKAVGRARRAVVTHGFFGSAWQEMVAKAASRSLPAA